MENEHEKIWTGKRARRVVELEVIDGGSPTRATPCSAEAEEHVLACCLLDGSDSITRALGVKLSGDAFYSPANRLLFELIVELYRSKPPVTLEMLAEELKMRRQLEAIGGFAYLMQITAKIPTTAHAGYFIEAVKTKWVLRKLIESCTLAAEEAYAYTGSGGQSLETLILPLAMRFNRAVEYARAGEETMIDVAARAYKRTLLKLENKHDKSRQIFTGLPAFDTRFGPFDPYEEDWLNGILAVTSGGKSAFARKVADHNLVNGKKGMIFLFETSIGKYLDLSACTAARVNARLLNQLPKDLEARFRTERELRQGWIGKTLFIYEDKPPVETMGARIDDHIRQHGPIDFVVGDHLHEMRSKEKFRGNREAELEYVAQFLAAQAKRLNIPFFIPMQMNRSATKDGQSRRPNKHDVKGSSGIEQACSRMVILDIPKTDINGAEQTQDQTRVMVDIIQDKSRNGPLGHREFWFDRPYTDYVPLRDHEFKKQPGTPGGTKSAGGYGRS